MTVSIPNLNHESDGGATSSGRSSPVTVTAPVTPNDTTKRPYPASDPPKTDERAHAELRQESGQPREQLEMFDFDMDTDPTLGDLLAPGRSCALEIVPSVDEDCELADERTEEQVMLDMIGGLEDDAGPDIRAVWDAAGKPAPIEASMLWDVVATPAMMRQLSAFVREQRADGS